MQINLLRITSIAILSCLLVTAVRGAENPVYNELRNNGITLSNGIVVKAREPVLADGLNAKEQEAAIGKVVTPGVMRRGFMFGGRNDSYQYDMSKPIMAEKPGPNPPAGRTIDLYFVAEGSMESVDSKAFMDQQVNKGQGEDRGEAKFLTEDELKKRNISLAKEEGVTERYAKIEFPLFNMVQINGVGYGVQTKGKDSVLVAFRLDPRFTNDKTYPNEWRPIIRNAQGNPQPGAPTPYEAAGGYVKVTKLEGQKKPRVFVEYHLIFDEPYGWFNGGPTLTSKLPIQYENDVREFRADLRDFERKNPPALNAAGGNAR